MNLNLVSNTPWTGWFNRDLIENMPVGVYVCDHEGVLVAYNKKAATIWGREPVLGDSQQRFCGAHRLHLSDGTYVPHHLTPLAQVLETQQPYAFEAMVGRPDGTLRNVAANVAPLFDDQGKFVGFVNCVLDITDSKRTTEHRDRMWNLSLDLMATLSLDGGMQAVNPAWTATLGWPRETLLGADIAPLIHPQDSMLFAEKLRAVALLHKVATFEARLLGKDGQACWASWNLVSDGAAIHVVARDISVQKEQEIALQQAEEALRQSQKMEAIGLLTGGVAHDFNNYLTVIRGSADILKLPNLPAERRERFIAAISDTADRAARLTAQLLAFARRQALKPETFDVCAAITGIRDMIGTLVGSRIEVELVLPGHPCFVHADPGQLDTVIVNMIVNARDAIVESGRITITVSEQSAVPQVRTHAGRQGSFVAIAITDTGSGIGQDHLDRIFEPFFTTKPTGEGTGLGLSQVFGFAKQSGGEIAVDSTPGVGTTFTLFLDSCIEDCSNKPVALLPTPMPAGHATRILVVEDNPEVGAFAQEMLGELGYVITLVAGGQAALAILASGQVVDVVFSDIEMPGMDGLQLARHIRQARPALPILLTTGYTNSEFGQGMQGYEVLQKPYSIEQLATAMQRLAALASVAK